MNSTEKILILIEKEEVLSILAENALVEKFKELLKYELIEIVGDKIVLTPTGKDAKITGIDKIISEFQFKEQLIKFSVITQKKEFKLIQLSVVVLLSFLLFFLTLIIGWDLKIFPFW